jgi:GNAT superfamily N-acetyltransferase
MEIQVKPVTRSDYPEWLPLWNNYNEFYGRSGLTALDPSITQTTWLRFFESDEPVHAIVAKSEGRLVGLAHYIFHRSTTAIHPYCYLQDLYTHEAFRGKGIASALILKVYEQAKLGGSPRLYWQTHETNVRAMRLYDKLAERSGFIVYRKLV